MADLAKLVVRLEAETSRYQRELESARKQLGRFERDSNANLKRIGGNLIKFGAAAAAGLAAMSVAAINSADEMKEMSEQFGISTEQLSQLAYAADIGDASIQDLGKGLARLSRNAADAARGLEAPKRAFDALGISATNVDGSLKGTEQLMLEIADRFSKIEDGAGKAALAQELFGRSGVSLIPFLNQGRGAIEALKNEADQLGLTLSAKTAAAAEQFTNNLKTLRAAGKGLALQFAEEMLPALNAITDAFVAFVQNGEASRALINALALSLKALFSAALVVSSTFVQFGKAIGGVAALSVASLKRDIPETNRLLAELLGDQADLTQDTAATIAGIWSDASESIEQDIAKADAVAKESLIFGGGAGAGATGGGSDPAAAALERLQKMTAELRQQIAVFGQSETATVAYRIAQGDLAAEFETAGAAAIPLRAELIVLTAQYEALAGAGREAGAATGELATKMQEAQAVVDATRTPLERFNAEIERLNSLRDTFVNGQPLLDPETYTRAVEAAQDALESATTEINTFAEQASRNTQDIIAKNLRDGFSDGAKGILQDFADLIRDLVAQAVAADLAKRLFGSGGVGSGGGLFGSALGFLGDLFTADRGGHVSAGTPVMIGTGAQPELFVPDTAGDFYPAGTHGGGMNVVMNFTVNSATGTISPATESQIAAAAARGLMQANRRNN